MKNQTVRIIGGKWRSRKIHFPEAVGLRPTPDRVRETVFNWLTPVIRDAVCLDLFAGSGALGFEALSRGAKSVVMVDQAVDVVKSLQDNAARFTAEDLTIYRASIPAEFNKLLHQKFNIVFLDPPFHQNLIASCCDWLEQHAFLADNALIYLEMESSLTELALPANWKIERDQKAGEVRYCLAMRSS